jgi:hypothetical protein
MIITQMPSRAMSSTSSPVMNCLPPALSEQSQTGSFGQPL